MGAFNITFSPPLQPASCPVPPLLDPFFYRNNITLHVISVNITNTTYAIPIGKSPSETFPVLALMHGNSYYGSWYLQIISQIASYGYIVIAPDYQAFEIGNHVVLDRVRTMRTAIQALFDKNEDANSVFYQKVNTGAGVVLAGHSWGGATVELTSLLQGGGIRGIILLDIIPTVHLLFYRL